MSHPPTAPSPAPRCAACGAVVSGRFCAQCGAAALAGNCAACGTPLSPGARFCHQCGSPVRASTAAASRERLGWIVAGIAIVASLLLLFWRSGSFRPGAPPEMANAGNAGAPGAAAGLSTQAPDISSLTPEQRFDRLFDRVVRASENGDSITVQQFSPMALGAYGMLGTAGSDQRFHAALIHLAIADYPGALALADTILAQTPGHLFGYLIRGEVADRQNRADALTAAYRDFLAHYDAELRAGRSEYAEHKPVLDDFKVRAQASTARP